MTETTGAKTPENPPDQELRRFDEAIREDHLIGQWSFEPLLEAATSGPTPRGKGHVWPWKTTRTRLAEASETLGPAGLGRCNLTFLNPGITQGPPGSTHTMAAGVQIMRAQEVCWSHRHTMSALRFVIEGNPEAFTAVDGEPLTMDTFDLLITPRFSWHDHHNPTDDEVVWLDVLDLGLTLGLNQAFYEPYGEASQPQRPHMGESQGLRAKSLRPVRERPRLERLPIRYPWADVVEILDAYGDTTQDPYDGLALRYANPVTGGPTMTTLDCWIQQLPPGFQGLSHRRTSSSVGFVVSGHGRVEVGDDTLDIGPGDTFAVPNFAWHRLLNDGDEPLRIFSVHDIPALTALGLFYEEPVPVVAAHPAPAVPARPLKPHFRTDAMLAPEEER
ncbi:cupin domain-containing protein [Streptomyces sp. NPDC057474]|uniref:cupin domain-containing protein n=1 Tax=Streptomyces sp. NPDC057474 TaxID=3346144 RepID=UPI003682744F